MAANIVNHKSESDLNNSSPDISNSSNGVLNGHETDSACEEDIFDDDIKEILGDEPESVIPQQVLDLADHALARLPPIWRNWITRIISGLCLISGFSFLISLGPIGLFFLTFLVEFSSYNEFLKLGQRICGVREKIMSKWCWTLFFVFHWITMASMGEISQNLSCLPLLETIFKYKIAIGFTLYMGLLVFFVLTTQLHDRLYMRRYALFAWCHVWSLFFTMPAFLLNKATMSGLIWYVMPMSLITINDIGAYMVGFFGGKTPLIKLSPKKTREGFIGGGIITVILGTILTHYLIQKPYLVCPVECNMNFLDNLLHGELTNLFSVTQCQPLMVFQPTHITFGSFSFDYYPFVMHGFLVSLFSSLIGPFGGFLASGLKRACRQKNFGSLIPGHGGVLDRCDCMFLMAVFSYVYLETLKQAEIM